MATLLIVASIIPLAVSFAWLAESTSLATRAACDRSDMGSCGGSCDLRGHDREFDIQVRSVVSAVWTKVRLQGFEIPAYAVIKVVDHAF